MKSSKTLIYEKNNIAIRAHDSFVYHSTVYKLWKGGASLVEEKYYCSPKPLKIKKSDKYKKFKDYKLVRWLELEWAPEYWLEKNGYKLIEK